jgi:hypothetical protein
VFVGSKPSLGLLFVRKILPFDVLRYNEMLLALLSKNCTEVVQWANTLAYLSRLSVMMKKVFNHLDME